MTRSYQDYLIDILDAAEKALNWVKDIDLAEFTDNTEKVYATTRALEIIGEAARHMPQNIQDQYPEVPWSDMIGMRNVVTHGYFGVNSEVIWRTIQEDLPPLATSIAHILAELDLRNNDTTDQTS
ncbi:MAG TPA: DUF86 domain-containing protein [Anaerolineae bacterium]|nr:DUF86 domain-containing protein [Anaerolineae bacterium]